MTELQLTGLAAQFLWGAVGTLSFGVLFGIPRKHYLACALDGAVGWVVYELAVMLGQSPAMAALLASIPLTLLARVFAITLKAPVTVFLLCGIFPLVPGAGIYYTAYYFILNNNELFAQNGMDTLKTAVALAVGISLVLGLPLPQKRRKKKPDGPR